MINIFKNWNITQLSSRFQLYQQNIKQIKLAEDLQQLKLQYVLTTLPHQTLSQFLSEKEICKALQGRDSHVLKEALSQVCSDFDQYDNKKLVLLHRIQEYKEKQRQHQQHLQHSFQIISVALGGMILLSLTCQFYYYLEYDISITNPKVSDYHIYRFR